MTLEVLTVRPQRVTRAVPLLFVHGAFVGAWCWGEYFLPWFAGRGYDAHAVSLRGHGASPGRETLDAASLDDYVADVVEAASMLPRPPVLIGHSMGAIVVQRAARRARASAMVLMGPVPPHGLGGSPLSLALRDPPLFFALNAMQLGGSDAPTLRRVRDYLLSASLTEAEVIRHLRRAQHESQRALLELVWPQHLWICDSVGLPTLVLGAGDDVFFPPRDDARGRALPRRSAADVPADGARHDARARMGRCRCAHTRVARGRATRQRRLILSSRHSMIGT